MDRLKLPLLCFVPAFLVLSALFVLGMYDSAYIPALTRDMNAQASLHPLTGLVSNAGILLWSSTGSICLFGAWAIRNVRREHSLFLASAGSISLYLAADDLLMIHETLAPVYAGLSESVVYAAIGTAVFFHVVAFRRIILSLNYIAFVLALIFLASSIVFDSAVDVLEIQLVAWGYFFEDGVKWLGIAMWAGFHIATAGYLVEGAIVGQVRASA